MPEAATIVVDWHNEGKPDAMVGNYYLIELVSGFEWLIPALYLKIVYGCLAREEPYRPRLGQAAS